MNTSELIGSVLDYWVARAEGADPTPEEQMRFMPSTDWAQAGAIISREGMAVCRGDAEEWFAGWQASSDSLDLEGFRRVAGECWQSGPTPLVAAMRAYVAAKFGDKVVDKP